LTYLHRRQYRPSLAATAAIHELGAAMNVLVFPEANQARPILIQLLARFLAATRLDGWSGEDLLWSGAGRRAIRAG
jgi:hypothetical protein